MKTRLLFACLVCFVCLNTTACLRSLDNNKIPCTTSDHCPSHYICVNGTCARGSNGDSGISSDAKSAGDASRSEMGDTRLVAEPDSATRDANTGSSFPETGGAGGVGGGGASGGGTAGVDGGSGLARDASVPDLVSTGGSTTGGVATSGNTAKTGGIVTSGGTAGGAVVTSNTAAGVGGASGTGTAISSSSKAGASGGTTTAAGGTSTTSTGGTSASGGISSSGGTTATGGASSSSASTCQPKPRDCTSTLDNNCNGTPDNQETSSCACPVGQKRDCQEHPGYDGVGICKKGSQTCAASSDKTTSNWGECTGAVGPVTEVCDAAGVDENCNGQPNEGCECVNGTSVPCDCGPATTCTNGKKGTCSVSKVTLYRDFDGDGYGDSAQPTQFCPGTSGYVNNSNDCDDRNFNFYPGVSVCSSATQSKSCSSGGVTSNTTCDYGCAGAGQCHPAADGTIGLPGYVSCTNVSNCLAGDGCLQWDTSGLCGTTGSGGAIIRCDGPNDCPGQKCLMYRDRLINEAKCYPAVPSDNPDAYAEVCDPMASTCQAPRVCRKQGLTPLYECE